MILKYLQYNYSHKFYKASKIIKFQFKIFSKLQFKFKNKLMIYNLEEIMSFNNRLNNQFIIIIIIIKF